MAPTAQQQALRARNANRRATMVAKARPSGPPSMTTQQLNYMLLQQLRANAVANQDMMADPIIPAEVMERDPNWGVNPFGPGLPFYPQAINARKPWQRQVPPRVYEYPVSENIQIGSRDSLTPWNILQQAADQPVFRKCIQRRKSICDLEFAVTVDPKYIARQLGPGDTKSDIEASLRRKYMSEIARVMTWMELPDCRTGADYPAWAADVMEAHLVFDAVAIDPHLTRGGDLMALTVTDGKLMKPLIDEYGATPQPPLPAYQQIMYGYPRGEYGSVWEQPPDGEARFTADEIYYTRRVRRRWTQYGLPPTETALIDGLLWSRRFAWILGEYTEGVQPASFMVNHGDVEWSAELNMDYERMMNDRLSGNTAERMRYKLLPVGIEPVQSVMPEERYRPDYDLFILKLVAGNFGMPITEIGFTETGALGSSFHEGNQDILNRQTRIPDSMWLSKLTTRLLRRYLRMPEALRFWILGLESEDEAADDAVADTRVKSGRMTLNQDLARRGLAPYNFAEADKPMLMTDRGLIFIEDASKAGPPGTLIQPPHVDETPGAGNAPPPARAHAGAGGTAAVAPGPVAKHIPVRQPADHVVGQLAEDYPISSLQWVHNAVWHGPQDVPLSGIDYDNAATWQASHEMERVHRFAQKMQDRQASGGHVKAAVLVRVPGQKRLRVIDGHHRALAARSIDHPLWAWIGDVSHETGPWDTLHDDQFHEGEFGASPYPDPAAKDMPDLRKAELASLGRWLARNPRPHRPFMCKALTAADLGEMAADPRIRPADGPVVTPKGLALTGTGRGGNGTRN
jgi:hypothetical protein